MKGNKTEEDTTMKTKEELNTLKQKVETLNKKLEELTDDELKQVTGGAYHLQHMGFRYIKKETALDSSSSVPTEPDALHHSHSGGKGGGKGGSGEIGKATFIEVGD